MSRRIEIELTSTRDDGSWTWRAAGAREPKGTLDGAILPSGASVGDVLRAEIEGYLDGLSVVSIVPPRAPRAEPERIELRSSRRGDSPLVTTDVRKRSSDRGRRTERGRRGRDEGDRARRDRDRGADRDRDRQSGRHERGRAERGRPERPARSEPPAVETKPKPKRLRPARTHRAALLESLAAEQRPIAEQLLQGGIPAVRQAIDKQNESLRAEGKPEVGRDSLLKVAEDLRPRALAALWRDRAEAAAASVDDLDLRDLRSVVNAAGDGGRDEEARALATQLREALANRVEKEHSSWLAELADNLRDGRVVRALRLSSRPPKAGAPIPTDLTNQLAAAAAASLTEETSQDRWSTVLEALAYSPVRRRVIPESLPTKLSPALRETVARLGSRLPEIAHIFAIEPDESAGRAPTGPRQPRRRPRGADDRSGARSGPGSGGAGASGTGGPSSGGRRSGRRGRQAAPAGTDAAPQARSSAEPAAEAPSAPTPDAETTASGSAPTEATTAPAEQPSAAPAADAPAADAPATDAPAPEADAPAPADAAPTADAAPSEAESTPVAGPDPAPETTPTHDAETTVAAPAEPDSPPAAEAPADAAPAKADEPGDAPTDATHAKADEPGDAPTDATHAKATDAGEGSENGGGARGESHVIEAGTMPADEPAT
jgi:hypothetical protein